MNRYVIAAEARRDLDDIWLYIARHDLRAAEEWLSEVEQRFQLLSGQPMLGQEREDLLPALRFLPVGNYLIFYRPQPDGIHVLRVIHGARDYGPEYF